MRHAQQLQLLLLPLLLLFTRPTIAVTISLVSTAFHSRHAPGAGIITTNCTDILPGLCCMHPDIQGASTVMFDGLAVSDIAATWGVPPVDSSGTNRVSYCSGPMLETRVGPGTWIWRAPSGADAAERGLTGFRASGASYITVPKALPPDGKTSMWAMGEGILAMAWGGGSWFGDPKARSYLGDVATSRVGPRSRLRRDVRSVNKGKLWARRPLKVAFPDVVEIDGTQYAGDGTGDMMYAATDSGGASLNLTALFLGKPL